jgi:CDP-glycerol glycerophosphotransferase
VAAGPGARYTGARPDRGAPPDPAATIDAVLALAARPEVPDARRRLVLPALMRHELARLERLPADERAAYFATLAAAWRRHRGAGETLGPGRVAALETRALERGDHRLHRAVRAASKGRRGAVRARAGVTRRARRTVRGRRQRRLERGYRAALRKPIDPDLAVFAAYWYRGYSCNPKAIYEKARELVPGFHGVWVVNPKAVDAMPAGVDYVVRDTPEYFETIARARVLVNNVNFPNHLVKREGTIHVMTHHGTPLKRMGMDLQATPIAGRKMDFDALMRRCSRWDFSVSSNHFSTEIWKRVYPTAYESLDVGYPRNDALVNAGEEDVRRIRAELGIEPGQTAVLYAPTHREYRSSYVPVLDLAAVAEGLGPDFVVLARAHYFYDADRSLQELHRQGRVRDVAAHPVVEELCLAADVLLTDYSSIMFDYAVLDRPIVIHAPDWEAYRALRGTYFDLLAAPPGAVTRTEDEVIASLRSGEAQGDAAARARAAFRERFCSLEDGRAAERVVRRVWLGEREAAAAPPAPVAR